jgi:hypothetical protein
MREGPLAGAPVVMKLQKGDVLARLDTGVGDWCKVGALGREGYVSCKLLRALPSDEPSATDPSTGDGTDAFDSEDAFASADAGVDEIQVQEDMGSTEFENAIDSGVSDPESSNENDQPLHGIDRSGGFFKLSVGASIGNFDLTTADDESDVGKALELTLGITGTSGFGFGITGSIAEFIYRSVLLEALGLPDELTTATLDLGMLDLAVWYFAEASRDVTFHLRGGLGATAVQLKTPLGDDDGASMGVVLGGGLSLYLSEHFGLSFDAVWRSYGLELGLLGNTTGELSTFGLMGGIIYR